jgi:Raf kinase inhibitor-like YbhB/YbcL family protein
MRVVWFTALIALRLFVAFPALADSIGISSPAFVSGQPMPAKFSYKGRNLSPELHLANVPGNAKSLVLIVDDPDSPSGLWTHWLIWNLPATTTVIHEGEVPSGAVQGKNSFGNDHYDGPVPPSGTHRYVFHVYALNATLTLPAGASREALDAAIKDQVVATGETFGTYSATP